MRPELEANVLPLTVTNLDGSDKSGPSNRFRLAARATGVVGSQKFAGLRAAIEKPRKAKTKKIPNSRAQMMAVSAI